MAVEREFTRQAPMVLTEEQRWVIQRTSDGRRQSMSLLVREAIDEKYGLIGGKFPAGDPRIEEMEADPLPPSKA